MTGYDVIDLFKRELAAFPFRAGMISTDEFKKELLGSLYGTLNGYQYGFFNSLIRCWRVPLKICKSNAWKIQHLRGLFGRFNSLCDGIRENLHRSWATFIEKEKREAQMKAESGELFGRSRKVAS